MYSILLMLAAAAPLPPPGPKPIGDPGLWITLGDYPYDAFASGKDGAVMIEIIVDETGHAARCRVMRSSGTESLDRAACAAIARRGLWEPSLDDAGRPIFAAYRRQVKWVINNSNVKSLPSSVDMEIEVAKLPIAQADAKVFARQIQRPDGSEDGCSVAVPSPSQALNMIACDVAKPLTKLDPIVNAKGEFVRGVRWRAIQFVEATGTNKPD